MTEFVLITIHSATQIAGNPDPCVKFTWGRQTHETSTARRTSSPEWNQFFALPMGPRDGEKITLSVVDVESVGNDVPIGQAVFNLGQLQPGVSDGWYDLINGTYFAGKIRVILERLESSNAPSGHSQSGYAVPPLPLSAFEALSQLVPNADASDIKEALERHNGFEEQALWDLLNSSIHKIPAKRPSLMSKLKYTGGAFSSFVSGNTPPSQWLEKLTQIRIPNNISTDPTEVLPGNGRLKSLLIGINYIGQKGELKGCIADVSRIKQYITTVHGFPEFPEAMVVLTDDSSDPKSRPTKSNIIYAMKWLVNDAQPGDVFFLHYSGHGSQKENKKGLEIDGMDETILPVDYQSSGIISDDEINALLVSNLPSGCRLTAVMDCCHSGSGMDLPFGWDVQKSHWQEERSPTFSAGDVQMFSGCNDSEVSADIQNGPGTEGGAMTTAFLTAVAGNPDQTYTSLLEGIRKGLNSRGFWNQVPQLTSTQEFPTSRTFNLTDVTPNHNASLGYHEMKNPDAPKKGLRHKMSQASRGAPAPLGGGRFAQRFQR